MWECNEGFWLNNCFFHCQGSVQGLKFRIDFSQTALFSHSSLHYCLCSSTTELVCLWYDHLASMHCKIHPRNNYCYKKFKMKLYLKTWFKSLTKQRSCAQVFLWCVPLFKIYLNLCYLLKPLMASNSSFLEYGFDSMLYSLQWLFCHLTLFYVVSYFHMQ